jgi:hypothetical protein
MIGMNKAADLNTIEFRGFLSSVLQPRGIISVCLQVQQDMFLTVLFILLCTSTVSAEIGDYLSYLKQRYGYNKCFCDELLCQI